MGDIVITPASNDVNSTAGTLNIRTSDSYPMLLKTSNVERISITAAGLVGIGTTAPTGKLHVYSSITGDTLLRADGTNGTIFSVTDDLSNSLLSVNNSAGIPVLEVFADDRVVAGQYGSGDFVLINNKVGIGTSNPAYKLDVRGSGVNARVGLMEFGTWPLDTTYIYLQNNSLSLIGANYGFLQSPAGEVFVNAAAGQTLHFRIGNVEKWAVTSAGILQSDGAQTIRTSTGPLTLATNAADGHIILSPNGAGNVGIGVTSPVYKLEVNGNFAAGGTSTIGTTYPQLTINGATNQHAYVVINRTNYEAGVQLRTNGTAKWYMYMPPADDTTLRFNSQAYGDSLTIKNDGNVGIGTTNPSFKLHTAGAGFIGRQNSYGTYDAADADLIISNYNSDNTSILLFNSAGAYNSSLINYYNNILSLGLNNDNSSNLILTSTSINITAAGVGIGTSVITGLLNVTRNSNTAQPIAFFKELFTNPAATNLLLLERGNNLSAANQTTSNAGLRIRDHLSNYSLSIEDHNSNVNFAISGTRVLIGSTSTASLLNIGGAGSTLAASGITFGGDAQANLYRSAEDTIKTDGSLVVAANATFAGNVGIGLTNPEATSALHIKNLGAAAKVTIESANDSESLINFSAQASEYSVGFVRDGSNVNSLRFCNADSLSANEVMRLQNTNVGIGTNNPIFGLDVYKDTFRSLSRVSEKIITVSFPHAVANQKVDIVFNVTPGAVVFWGNLEVEITDGYSDQLATGKLIKVFALGLNPATGSGPYAASLYDNTSYYTAAYGAVADNYAIDGIFFNTTTGKYYFTIIHRTSTGNVPAIKIKGFTVDVTRSVNINSLTAGTVYTTNTTVYYKPVVETLQSRIGFNGNIDQNAALLVRGNIGVGTTNPSSRLVFGSNFASVSGITVSTDGFEESQFVARKAASKCAFGIMAWEAETYLSAGIYYNNSAWQHHNANNNNQLFVLTPGGGAKWYASNDATSSWNIASNVQLWNDAGAWTNLLRSTAGADSYILGGKFGIGTSSPTTLLSVGPAGSTSPASGITFGGDDEANLYRVAGDTIRTDGSFVAVGNLTVGNSITASSEYRMGLYLGYVATFPSIATAAYRWIILGPYNDTLTVAGNGLRVRGELFFSRGSNGENLRNARVKVCIGQGYNKDLLHADVLSIDSDSTTEQPILYSVYLNGFTSKYFAIDAAQLVSFSPSSLDAATVYYNGQFYDQSNDARSLTIQANTSITGAIGVVSRGGKIANALFAYTGNIGIGITAPSAKLEVNGPVFIPSTNGLYLGGTAGSFSSWQSIQYANGGYHVISSNGLIINNAGYSASPINVFTILTNTYDVGLSTNAPAERLHVYKTGLADNSTNSLLLLDGKFTAASVDSNDIVGIAFRVENAGGSAQRTTSIASSYQGGGYNALLLQHQGGNVGIGTINPTYKLDLEGVSTTSVVQNVRNPSLLWNQYALTRYQTDTKNSRYVDVGYFRGVSNEDTRGFVISGLNSNILTLLDIAGGYNLGLGGVTAPLFNIDVASTQGKGIQLRFDTGTGYRAQITPYWNNPTDTRIDFAINRSENLATSVIMSVGYNTNVGIGTTSPLEKLDVRGGILRTNSRISNSEGYPLGHYTPGETVFEIDPTWSQAELQKYFNSSNVTWVAVADAPGGYCIYIDGAVNVGGFMDSGFPYIPVDTNDIFYMECWIQNVGTSQGHYMGSQDFDHNFADLGGNPGSYGYWVMLNSNPTTTWTKVSGYIGGFSATATGQFKTGTKYWTPLALFNYTAGTGTRACRISGWKVIKVTQVGNRYFSGNVGIGTTNAAAQLHIGGTASNSNPWMVLDINDTYFKRIIFSEDRSTYGTTGYGGYIGYDADNNVVSLGVYENSAQNRVLNIKRENGNVGIGTTNPLSTLNLYGTAPTILTLGSTSYPSTYLTTFGVDSTAKGFLIFGNNGANEIRAGRTTAGGFLDFYTNNTVGQTTTASDGNLVMRLAANGNVGIGTTNPAFKLDVLGDLRVSGTTSTVGTFRSSATSCFISLIDSSNDNVFLGNDDGDFLIQTPTTSYSTKLIVKDGGNVGINTTSPYSLLDVQVASASPKYVTISTNDGQGSYYGFGLNFRIADTAHDIGQIRGVYENSNGGGFGGLAIATRFGGTLYDRVTFTDQGRVGIGLTNPTTILSVGGAGSTTAASGITFGADSQANLYRISSSRIKTDGNFTIDGQGGGATSLALNRSSTSSENGMAFTTAGSVDWYYYVDNGTTNLQIQRVGENDAAPRVRFNGANSDILFNLGGGNIGVGTATPTGKLHIYSTITGQTLIRADGTNGTIFSVVDDLSNSLLSVNNSAGIPVLEVFADDSIVMGQYGSGDLVVANNKVGIGTTNPNFKLTVNGDINILGTTSKIKFNGVDVVNTAGGGNGDMYLNCRVIRAESNNYNDGMFIGYNSAGTTSAHLRFYANGATERMRIQANNGFVGIGTDGAVGRLDVYASGDAENGVFIRNLSAGANAHSVLVLRRDGNTNGLAMFTNSSTRTTDGGAGNSTIRTDTNKLLLGAGGVTYHSLETNGNVGIGLTNPSAARLHIKGDTTNPVIRVETNSIEGPAGGTAGRTLRGWLPIMTGANATDKVYIPLFGPLN